MRAVEANRILALIFLGGAACLLALGVMLSIVSMNWAWVVLFGAPAAVFILAALSFALVGRRLERRLIDRIDQ